MFTGLIAEQGIIRDRSFQNHAIVLGIQASNSLCAGIHPGDSIAMNGICLTVTQILSYGFRVQAVSESISRTTLKEWQPGDKINLERPIRPDGYLDGHWVTGHIDGIAVVQTVQTEGESHRIVFTAPEDVWRFIAVKGSVALDGISLTVAEVLETNRFAVVLIPHTLATTTAQIWHPGQGVNLEIDIIARYVERLLGFNQSGSEKKGMTWSQLAHNGFL